jgi:hypothetical protein
VALVDCMATDPHASPRQSVGGWGRRLSPSRWPLFIRNASSGSAANLGPKFGPKLPRTSQNTGTLDGLVTLESPDKTELTDTSRHSTLCLSANDGIAWAAMELHDVCESGLYKIRSEDRVNDPRLPVRSGP